MEVLTVFAVAVLWVGTGLAATTWGLGRRGYRDRTWLLLGALLGPLYVPIALERGRRAPTEVDAGVVRTAGPAPGAGGPALLVGLDGSDAADAALELAVSMTRSGGRLELASVVGSEVAEDDAEPAARDARDRALTLLRDGARRAGRDVGVHVLSGQPAPALAEAARSCGVDAVVVGRRGRGLTSTLLGSTSVELSRRSDVPVLLVPGQRSAG